MPTITEAQKIATETMNADQAIQSMTFEIATSVGNMRATIYRSGKLEVTKA